MQIVCLISLLFCSGSVSFMLPSTLSTVANYDGRIDSFSSWAFGSEAAEAQRLRELFTSQLNVDFPDRGAIIDIGCGPGRDLYGFIEAGFNGIGLEPSDLFCDSAIELLLSKFPMNMFSIIQGDICDTELIRSCNLGGRGIIGAFCLASLFHVPYSKLPTALINIKSVLVPNGLIFSSFPIRPDTPNSELEGLSMPDGRWCTGLSVQQHHNLLTSNNFSVLQSFDCNIYNGNWNCIIARKN